MKRVATLFGVAAACCAVPGFALDLDPGSRAKAIAAAAAPPSAPTAASAHNLTHNPLPDLPFGTELEARAITGGCASRTDLCYDYRERKLVYRPSRNWMPEINGLTPEHMSLRRGVVSFKYSFK